MNSFPQLLNSLIADGLTLNNSPLWIHGDQSVSRKDAQAMINECRYSFDKAGLNCGDRIAIHGKPDSNTLSALIAGLLNGLVIIPIDCSLTDHRKTQMLELSSPQVVYDSENTLNLIPELKRIELDFSGTSIIEYQTTVIESDLNLPCYIFFTSGSTGTPKAVLGQRSSLAHFVGWERDMLNLTQNDKVALLTRFSFDVVLRDILLPLTSGATSVLPMSNEANTAQSIARWIASKNISVIHTVPSIAQSILSATNDKVSIECLRETLFAGEPLHSSLVDRWKLLFPNTVIHNLYGPTETTLAKFHARITEPPINGVQSCGYPLPDVKFIILSPKQTLMPQGELGEVAIETPYTSLGYLHNKYEIKEIMSDIFGRQHYLTGDLGFIDSNEELHLRGRKDDQIKIMGVRFELSGIAAILELHPLISKAILLANTAHKTNQKQIIAWYLTHSGKEIDISDIRSFMIERCPIAAIPSRFIHCEFFQLTPNGKIDKNSLHVPDQKSNIYVPPATNNEIIITEVFATELGLDKVSVTDDFFSLGGDSLVATAISVILSERLSFHVDASILLDASTPQDLAKLLENQPRKKIVPIPTAPDIQFFSLTPQQRRYVRTFCANGNRNWCNMVALFDLPNDVSKLDVLQAIGDIAVHHDSLRIVFSIDETGEILQKIDPTSDFKLDVVDLSKSPESSIKKQLSDMKVFEGEKVIDLFSKKSCFRACLIILPQNQRKLLWNVHHMVSDGTSQGILSNLLNDWFKDKVLFRNSNNNLISYKDIACFFSNQNIKTISNFFPDMLSKPNIYKHKYFQVRNKTLDHQRCHSYEHRLSNETTIALRSRARTLNCTPYIILLSAYFQLISQISETNDIAIVTPLAGRAHPEIRNVIGNFINLVSLRISNLDELDSASLVFKVRELLTEATRHQLDQFDQVIDSLGLPFLSDRNPLTGVSLNYMPQVVKGPEIMGIHKDLGYKLKYDLLFLIRDFSNSLNIEIQYRIGSFDTCEIESVFSNFEQQILRMCYDK
ncbi:AMP-binding protein [Marinomonas sp. TI.3.20]|uniref:AMP-binding protein n=1 Tax=Marinomonas sp. TI.3.20 TaxID=3121296 RepID=UPI00311FE595